jgi:hypothetical protein
MDWGSLHGLISMIIPIILVVVLVWAVVKIVQALSRPKATRQNDPPVHVVAPATDLTPGWYPDQHDLNLMRYFDGRAWTTATQPRN